MPFISPPPWRNERVLEIGATGKLFETTADLFSYL